MDQQRGRRVLPCLLGIDFGWVEILLPSFKCITINSICGGDCLGGNLF